MDTDEWICLYAQKEEKISYKLLDGFIKCAKGYGIRFKNNDSNWIPMSSQNPKVWINLLLLIYIILNIWQILNIYYLLQ